MIKEENLRVWNNFVMDNTTGWWLVQFEERGIIHFNEQANLDDEERKLLTRYVDKLLNKGEGKNLQDLIGTHVYGVAWVGDWEWVEGTLDVISVNANGYWYEISEKGKGTGIWSSPKIFSTKKAAMMEALRLRIKKKEEMRDALLANIERDTKLVEQYAQTIKEMEKELNGLQAKKQSKKSP